MLILFLYRASQQPIELHAAKAKETNINNSLSVQGTLEPGKKSAIAADSRGIVCEVYVENGQHVQAGTPLVRIEGIEEANVDPVDMIAAYWGKSFTTNVQAGKILYADINGIVSAHASVGETLYPAETAVTLADFAQTMISIEVPELYAAGLSLGQRVKAEPVSGNGIAFSGILSQIDESVTEKVDLLTQSPERVVNCMVTLSEKNADLRSGTSMEVTIITDSVNRAVTVPYTAIHQDDTQEYVYVISDEGLEKRPIETGYHLISDVQIEQGITAGEWVLTDKIEMEELSNGFWVSEV